MMAKWVEWSPPKWKVMGSVPNRVVYVQVTTNKMLIPKDCAILFIEKNAIMDYYNGKPFKSNYYVLYKPLFALK